MGLFVNNGRMIHSRTFGEDMRSGLEKDGESLIGMLSQSYNTHRIFPSEDVYIVDTNQVGGNN